MIWKWNYTVQFTDSDLDLDFAGTVMHDWKKKESVPPCVAMEMPVRSSAIQLASGGICAG
jgi:hypothetical protein